MNAVVRITLTALSAVALAGCPPDLSGTWSSDWSCSGDGVGASEPWVVTHEFSFFVTEATSDTYLGEGEHSFDLAPDGDTSEGPYWEYDFEIELVTGRQVNAEAWDVSGRFDECVEVDLGDIDCPPPFSGRTWPVSTGQVLTFSMRLLDQFDCYFYLE